MEQVFFIADLHLGDHNVFTKDQNGKRKNVNVAVRDNLLLDMWMSQVGKKDCVYILGDLMAYRGLYANTKDFTIYWANRRRVDVCFHRRAGTVSRY
jgi:calcineurin-like phosphoesterase family protein